MTITLLRVSGPATVQDLGRPGFMHMGVPRGGALVPELIARANAAARNAPSEAAIELHGSISVRADCALTLGTDDGHAHELALGETFTLPPSPHVRYVAVRGGILVPQVLGGRGTLLTAKLGGHEGRALARGDVLAIGNTTPVDTAMPPPPSTTAMVRVLPGPDLAHFTSGLSGLTRTAWHVGARHDRAGVLLSGSHVHRSDHGPLASAPMVRGAIQVPPSGEPIVLGPDHPTTGGYPVIAVIVTADLGAFFARPTHAQVELTEA